MEKSVLRVLVIVLAATCLGLWALACNKLDLNVPVQNTPRIDNPKPPPDPTGAHPATGAPAPSGALPATGAPPATGTPAATGTQATPAPAPKTADEVVPETSGTGKVTDYFISLEGAKLIWDSKKWRGKDMIFVDAREYREYAEGHIAGAMSCPKQRFDGAVPKYVRNYLPGNGVVVYCHGAECTDSEAVVRRLVALNLQISPLFIIKDGIPAWEKAGYPINKGDNEGFVN
jgi:rhodanese-related sulfurtransferase